MAETRSIAEMIRDARQPTGEMFELSRQAARLMRALAVAREWSKAAAAESATGEMWERAETIQDELEEELARVSFTMEVEAQIRREEVFNRERDEEAKVKDVEMHSSASTLSEALIEAYSILSRLPEEHLSYGAAGRRRRERATSSWGRSWLLRTLPTSTSKNSP